MTGESVGAACFDTLVVGGGMVGSALALGLSRQGWNTGLVEGARVQDLLAPGETASHTDDFEPRVSAISLASEQLQGGGDRRCIGPARERNRRAL